MVPFLSYHPIEAISLSRERNSKAGEVARAITVRGKSKTIRRKVVSATRVIRNQRSEESS